MFVLADTFNDKVISRHRTLARAAKAKNQFVKALLRRSPGSYLPIKLMCEERGKLVEPTEDDRDRFDDLYCDLP